MTQAAARAAAPSGVALKDPKLFRQQCYVDGAWIGADKGGAIDVADRASAAIASLTDAESDHPRYPARHG